LKHFTIRGSLHQQKEKREIKMGKKKFSVSLIKKKKRKKKWGRSLALLGGKKDSPKMTSGKKNSGLRKRRKQ